MKNLLSTTALIAGIAFGGAAFAQVTIDADAQYTWTIAVENPAGGAPILSTVIGTGAEYTAQLALMQANPGSDITIVPETLAAYTPADDAAPYTSTSLLDSILADAAELSASVSNISQNLNDIDGSIQVETDRDLAGVASGISALIGTNPAGGFGSFSTVNANVYGSDLPDSLLAVLDPLTLTLGDMATTAIGTLQSGNMTGTFDADGLVSKVTSSAEGSTTGASMLAEQYAGIVNTVAMQNVSVNSGAINGSVDLALNDVNTMAGKIATTAIGALQSGTMSVSVAGQMGAVTDTTSGIVNALVGSSAN